MHIAICLRRTLRWPKVFAGVIFLAALGYTLLAFNRQSPTIVIQDGYKREVNDRSITSSRCQFTDLDGGNGNYTNCRNGNNVTGATSSWIRNGNAASSTDNINVPSQNSNIQQKIPPNFHKLTEIKVDVSNIKTVSVRTEAVREELGQKSGSVQALVRRPTNSPAANQTTPAVKDQVVDKVSPTVGSQAIDQLAAGQKSHDQPQESDAKVTAEDRTVDKPVSSQTLTAQSPAVNQVPAAETIQAGQSSATNTSQIGRLSSATSSSVNSTQALVTNSTMASKSLQISQMSIYTYTDIEARFIEAEKRLRTIPKQSLNKVGYPGVSVHRRIWKFPLTVPDCTAEVENLIIVVPSSPKNFKDRNVVRSTWGNATELRKMKSRLVFMVGLTIDIEVQKLIVEESRQLKDVVQLDIYDAYYNLTIKTLGMLSWAHEHCKTSKYVAKIDDDNLVHLPNILNNLDIFHKTHSKFMAGSYRNKGYASKSGKWADPVYEPIYKVGRWYPVFLGGPAYFMTNNFLDRLIQKCSELPLLHLEDVFVTGICGAQLKDVSKLYLQGMHMLRIDGCIFLQPNQTVVHDYPLELLQLAWDKWHGGNCTLHKPNKMIKSKG